jgi:hypothetical protein
MSNGPNESSTKTVKLSDLLTEEQLHEVERILNEFGEDKFEAGNKLRRYLEGFHEQLIQKGVVPGYLAYVIVWRQWTGGDNGDRVVSFSA